MRMTMLYVPRSDNKLCREEGVVHGLNSADTLVMLVSKKCYLGHTWCTTPNSDLENMFLSIVLILTDGMASASFSYVFSFIVLVVTRDPPTLVRSPSN